MLAQQLREDEGVGQLVDEVRRRQAKSSLDELLSATEPERHAAELVRSG